MKKVWNKLEIGTCYYPEHWNKSIWRDDLQRMLNCGIKTIRIAEFAWSKFEPNEGEFTFDFYDEFLEYTKEVNMKVIMGTPTATPPAWLTDKYPEVLNATRDGQLMHHGARRHYNYNSPVYKELCTRIVEKIAEHYGNHPSIIGWQIDNELNCEAYWFFSESDTIAYRKFLQEKYANLDNLNDAWGTVFWNQTYTKWEQIYVPRTTVNNAINQQEWLDFIRFISHSTIEFCHMQSVILRILINKDMFITTNGMFGHIDNHKMVRENLDVYTFDSYPDFAYGMDRNPSQKDILMDRASSMALSNVRSICPHFGIMEQQSGANGWVDRMEAPAPKPGQMLLWTMQSVAHGADYISFFRWRTSPVGTEIYWHGILDYDNRDNRKIEEVKKIATRFNKISEIAGADYIAEVAQLCDYDNVWDQDVDKWHDAVARKSNIEIFAASTYTATPIDYLYVDDLTSIEELKKYKVLIYPHAVILKPKTVDLLEEYVKDGGILIIGCRTGYKDMTGRCIMEPMPGLLRKIAGGNVRDFTFNGSYDDKVVMKWNKNEYEMPLFNDVLEPDDENINVLARYEGNYYQGKPALLEHKYGIGKCLYLGGVFTQEIMKKLLEYTEVIGTFSNIIENGPEVEISCRRKEDKLYLFVLNFSKRESSIFLRKRIIDMDIDEIIEGKVELKAYETKVYEIID